MVSSLLTYLGDDKFMTQATDTKELIKILIGAAWIDGKVQPEEKDYLCRIAQKNGVAEDPELKPFLYQLRPVTSQECYRWVESYIGNHPSHEDYEALIEALSGIIYSDGDVDTEEAKLLTRIQSLDPIHQEHRKSVFNHFLKSVRKLYREAVNQEAQ
jgi:uncharacterized tellurite resistance protein B-like protein